MRFLYYSTLKKVPQQQPSKGSGRGVRLRVGNFGSRASQHANAPREARGKCGFQGEQKGHSVGSIIFRK